MSVIKSPEAMREEMDALKSELANRVSEPAVRAGGDSLAWTQAAISEECDALKALLLEKNRKYGNSALEPARVFSRSSPVEQILVRIDDKLSRIRTSGTEGPDEDTVQDLLGYLILLRVAKRLA